MTHELSVTEALTQTRRALLSARADSLNSLLRAASITSDQLFRPRWMDGGSKATAEEIEKSWLAILAHVASEVKALVAELESAGFEKTRADVPMMLRFILRIAPKEANEFFELHDIQLPEDHGKISFAGGRPVDIGTHGYVTYNYHASEAA